MNVHEIEIRGPIGYRPVPGSSYVRSEAVLEQLAAAREASAVVLLNMESPGGSGQAARAIYDGLRAFQAAGGKAVAFLGNDGRDPIGCERGLVASAAPLLAVVADLAVVDPKATIAIHAAHSLDMRGRAPGEDAWAFRVYRSRTASTAEDLRWMLNLHHTNPGETRRCAQFNMDAAYAVAHGWADFEGDIHVARIVARLVASGQVPPTVRQARLTGRPPPPRGTLRAAAQPAHMWIPQVGDGYRPNDISSKANMPTAADGIRTPVGPQAVGRPGLASDAITTPNYAEATRPAWVGSTAYSLGDVRSNAGSTYVCIGAGTSAASGGPTGTATPITDGGATWAWLYDGTYATAGAKLDVTGTTLKLQAGGLRVGETTLAAMIRKYTATFSNTTTSIAVTLAETQPDTNFAVSIVPTGSSGTPPLGAYQVISVGKTIGTVTLGIGAQPGGGNSVTFDLMVIRAP